MEKVAKQVIVLRKDLNMRKGKMVSQGAHASMKAILDWSINDGNGLLTELPVGSALESWINGLFTKICVSVDSEEELVELYNKAMEAGLMVSMITDAGLTEFNGVPTKTCIAIGPDWSDEIDPITKHLKLL
jgi:PTH2 family peptidyl-tRNA hydrolase